MPSLLADGNRWGFQIGIPYWLLTLGTAALAALPELRCHFSLRTLLIAMTLVAVALAAIVYAWL
jgi:hypothetical protein